jgi:hypothetical protein
VIVGDLAEEAFFGGLDDAEGGEGDGDDFFAGERDGVFVAADVFEVAVDEGGRFEMRVEDGAELREGAGEEGEGIFDFRFSIFDWGRNIRRLTQIWERRSESAFGLVMG